MKLPCLTILCITVLAFSCSQTEEKKIIQQEQTVIEEKIMESTIDDKTTQRDPFKIRISLEQQDQVSLICETGCDWQQKTLHFPAGTIQFVSTENTYADKATIPMMEKGFAFSLSRTDNYSIELLALKGTSWAKLSGSNDPRGLFEINQNMIKVLD